MGKHRNPIKVKRRSGRRVPKNSILTKEQRVAHILLREGINYVENGNVGTIKNDEYVRTLLFDYSKQDTWEDDEERHLNLVRLPRRSNGKERRHTNGESTCWRDVPSKGEEGNTTNMCTVPPHKRNNGSQREGKMSGIVITPFVRTHDGVICKRGFIDKRTIGKIKMVNKKTPYGYHHRGKLPLKVDKRRICLMNPGGVVNSSSKNRSSRNLSNENTDGPIMETTTHSQWGEFIQLGRQTEDLNPCKRRTHFSPFQKRTIVTHKKEPLPIVEMKNEFVKIHFNKLNSISVASEDLCTPLGVDSLLSANTRKSFSPAHNVSTPFYGSSCLSCVELDRQRNCAECQPSVCPSKENKMEDVPSKEKRRKKLSRESHRNRAHQGDSPPRVNATPPKDGMCHSVNGLFCKSRNRDLFNERNNEIMVNEQGVNNQQRRAEFRREHVATTGLNMDVSFDSDLQGVQISVPDLQSHAFQAGTVVSKRNSGGKRQVRQFHGGGRGQTDLPNQDRSTPIVDKMKVNLNELSNMDKRRDMENAYVKYIYKRDESEEVPAEKRSRCVTFGREENDPLNNADVPLKRKNTRRTYKDQLRSVMNLRHANFDGNVHGFGETLKFMKYRELLRKYMGTFYNYSSVKCATYIILYALVVKIITQVSQNLTTSSGTVPSEKSNNINVVWYNDSNLFLNVHDMDGIIQSVCYVSLLVCIVLLLKLGIPSNYLLVGRLTILFMFLFFAQIPIMIYANFMALKKEEGIAKAQAKAFDKKDYFNLHMQRVYDVFYIDTLNLLVYTILLCLVSLYATYHKLIYPHLLKFYLDTIFLSSYTIVKKEVIQFRVPNNIDAYYLNQMNSYMFNSLYKKQDDLTKDNLESNTRSAIGYNIVIRKERCSLFRHLFRRDNSDSSHDGGGHTNGRSVPSGISAQSGRTVRRTCGWRASAAQPSTQTKWNMNFYIIFYIGELDDQGRPHGFGYWRGINLEGEVLIGYWFHGIPVGPFKCRDFKTGSGFMCIKIGYGRTNCEPNDLDIGLADTECCVSGAFYRTFPRVVFYDLNLTTPNRRSKKNEEGKHGIMEKRECCEYLHISRASNDILRVDYAKLLQDSEDDPEGGADPVRPDGEQRINHPNDVDENNSEILRRRNRTMGRIERKVTKGKSFVSTSSKEDHRKGSNSRSTMTYDEVPPSIVNSEPFLKGELLNYDEICNLSYDFNDLTLDNETHSAINKKMETSNELAEEEEHHQQGKWGVRQSSIDDPSAFPERSFPPDSPLLLPSSFSSSLFFPSSPSLRQPSSSSSSFSSSTSSSPSFSTPPGPFDEREMPTLLDEGDTHLTDVDQGWRAEMGATKLGKGRHPEHRAGRSVKYATHLSDHEDVHKKEKHKRRKKIMPSEKMEKGRGSKGKDCHASEEEQLSRRRNNHPRNDSSPDCELGKGDQVHARPRRKCQDMRMKHGLARQGGDNDKTDDGYDKRDHTDYDAVHGDDIPTRGHPRHQSNVAPTARIKRKSLTEHELAIPPEKPSLEFQVGVKKTHRGSQKREHKTVRMHMGDVKKRSEVGNSAESPVEAGSPDATKEGDATNEETDAKRKIQRRIGYSMTNTLLHIRKFKHLKIRKKKKKNIQTKEKTKTYVKKRNSGGRKTFLPRALSGTLPKLKIKKKKKNIFFSDTITNAYKTKCMNIILQNLCPHMPNFGILYNTDLHISIDAERGLYITGYINKKNCNFIHDRTRKNEFEDSEVKIKIIKRRKNTLNYKKGTNRRLYSWIDNIKELSLDGWVKCELAGCLEAVIFIHGYNTSHLEALQILGQMASFGNFPNYIKLFLFNWPSGKNFLEFFIAKDNSKNKEGHHAFKCFLDTLRSNGIRHVHIITHSMGTRMFLLAFHDIVKSDLFSTIDEKEMGTNNLNKMKLITLTMMNPEYYLSDFVNKEYVFLRSFCTVISIYCDSNDKALKWAEIFSGTKSLGKNVFDLNICKENYYKKSNGMDNYVFDSNKLDYFSIPVGNKTNESDDSLQGPKLVSSFFDCENFDVSNEQMRNKGMMTTFVQKLKKVFHFCKKRDNTNSNDFNEQTSMEHDQGKTNNDAAHQKFVHQPPMFRNTLLVFTGIEPIYSCRDNRDWLDVDVIDTTWLGSNVHTLRHSYWSLNREIIEDIRELIVTRKRARQRTSRLDRREGNVWVYRVAPSHLKSIFDSDI